MAVVVGYDGSDGSERALEWAVEELRSAAARDKRPRSRVTACDRFARLLPAAPSATAPTCRNKLV